MNDATYSEQGGERRAHGEGGEGAAGRRGRGGRAHRVGCGAAGQQGRARGGWICFRATRICLGGRVRRRTKCKMLQRLALHRTAAAAHPRIIRLWSLASVAGATEGEVDVVARGAAPIPRSLAGHHTRPAAAALTAARSAARWYLNLVTTISGVPRRLASVAMGTKGEIDVITRRTPPVSIATASALAATLAAAAAAAAALHLPRVSASASTRRSARVAPSGRHRAARVVRRKKTEGVVLAERAARRCRATRSCASTCAVPRCRCCYA